MTQPSGTDASPSCSYRATSMLATMRQRWNLGEAFSACEASAQSFADVFTLNSPCERPWRP
jgi:hypothetical protein